ncbi:hypothetical protein C1646_819006 [Rhizophagus diaphanus]|nr:hypothetical protein C1646_819006 [Rhizophagus diaphanus] [Rhizophagus sp. MUCL 43196]
MNSKTFDTTSCQEASDAHGSAKEKLNNEGRHPLGRNFPNVDQYTQINTRSIVVERLKKIFQLNRNQSFYHVVCGEHGTGKTTLTRIASREVGQDKDKGIQGGMGVIYYLRNIFVYGTAYEEILGDNVDRRPKWRRDLEAFKNAGTFFDTLQDDAKMSADHREYIAVFVSSVPRRMESRSAWSHAKQPVIEIGDLSNE